MTNKRLFSTVRIISLFFAGYFAVGVLLYHWPTKQTKDGPAPRLYPLYKDLMPLVIAIPAAYLGYSFQRRSSYLQALRELETLNSWVWIIGPERDPANHWAEEIPEYIKNAKKKP